MSVYRRVQFQSTYEHKGIWDLPNFMCIMDVNLTTWYNSKLTREAPAGASYGYTTGPFKKSMWGKDQIVSWLTNETFKDVGEVFVLTQKADNLCG